MSYTHRLVLASAALAPSALAQTNLIADGGFETPTFTTPFVRRAQNTTFDAWQVDNLGSGVAHVGTFGRPLAIEGAQCVELNWFVSGGVRQTIPTVPGQTYVISFLMAGQTDIGADLREIRVDFAGTTAGITSWSRSATGGHWVRKYVYGHATAATSVADFVGITPATVDGGPYIDDVRIVQCIDLTDHPDSAAVCPGVPFTLTVTAIGAATDNPLTYHWQMEDSTAVGGWRDITDGPVVIGASTIGLAQDAGTANIRYTIFLPTGTPLRTRCRVANSCGDQTSDAATLIVRDCPYRDCAADYDGSGGTPDVNDIAAFFIDWLNGTECADADCSGGTPDSGDISAFFTAWLAGGC